MPPCLLLHYCLPCLLNVNRTTISTLFSLSLMIYWLFVSACNLVAWVRLAYTNLVLSSPATLYDSCFLINEPLDYTICSCHNGLSQNWEYTDGFHKLILALACHELVRVSPSNIECSSSSTKSDSSQFGRSPVSLSPEYWTLIYDFPEMVSSVLIEPSLSFISCPWDLWFTGEWRQYSVAHS